MSKSQVKKKKKRPLKERIIIGSSIAVCIISVLVVGFLIVYQSHIFSGNNGSLKNDNLLSSETEELDKDTVKKLNALQSENFLVCGLDETEQLTDVIMLVCFNYQDNTINVLQIPRDTYIESGTGSTKKINSAYSGGDQSVSSINRLVKVINEQYQLKVDHYATINLESFRNVIDAIGGVPIDVPYDIGNAQLGIIYKGQQTLNGEQAEWLVRHRHSYYDQDIGRIKIQRLFLASAVQQVKKMGMSEVMKLIPAVFGNFTTDLSIKEVQNYAQKALSIDFSNIKFYIIPGEGTTTPSGQSVWTMHKYETADLLNAYFRPFSSPVSAESLKITELAHTGEYYENTEDDIQELINGTAPGKKKDDSTLPAYTHVVTAKPKVTTTQPATTTAASDTETTTVTTTYQTDEYGFIITEEETKIPDVIVIPETTETSDTLTNP